MTECRKKHATLDLPETEDDNVEVEMKFPDGRTVTVSIPNDTDPASWYHLEDGTEYGLNLVFKGHYT
jgi:hypothetical protein